MVYFGGAAPPVRLTGSDPPPMTSLGSPRPLIVDVALTAMLDCLSEVADVLPATLPNAKIRLEPGPAGRPLLWYDVDVPSADLLLPLVEAALAIAAGDPDVAVHARRVRRLYAVS